MVNELVVPEDGLIDILEAETDIEPAVIAPVGVPKMDDEDIEDDDDEEITADLPEEMTFGPDVDIPSYRSD